MREPVGSLILWGGGVVRYRAIRTCFWSDPEFEDWTFEEKSFYLYLITSPHTMLSGFMKLSLQHMMIDTGLKLSKIQALLKVLKERGKIRMNGKWIWIKKLLRYQNAGGKKVLIGVIRELEDILNPETAPLIKEMIKQYPELEELEEFYRLRKRLLDISAETVKKQESESNESKEEKTAAESENNETAQRTPYKEIVNLYHAECPDLPRVKVLNELRKRLIRARWKEHPDFNWWRQYFQKVHASDFLCGRVEPRNGKPPFLADLEWLVRPSNMVKVLEGRYDNRKPIKSDVDAILKEFDLRR